VSDVFLKIAGKEEMKMGALLRKAALLATAYLVIQTLPDLARYMKIRKM